MVTIITIIRVVTHDYIGLYRFFWRSRTVVISVRNFGCPCARDNQKSRRTTKNTSVVVRRTIINFLRPSWETRPHLIYLVPSTDNQKLGRTTNNNCKLVVRGTTIYFFLKTLVVIVVISIVVSSIRSSCHNYLGFFNEFSGSKSTNIVMVLF